MKQWVVDLKILGSLKYLDCEQALGSLMGWVLGKVDYSYAGSAVGGVDEVSQLRMVMMMWWDEVRGSCLLLLLCWMLLYAFKTDVCQVFIRPRATLAPPIQKLMFQNPESTSLKS